MLITNFNISLGQKIEKLAVLPDFLEVDWDPTDFGFDDGYFFGGGRSIHTFNNIYNFFVIIVSVLLVRFVLLVLLVPLANR